MSLKKKLESELSNIRFSEVQKDQLKTDLKLMLQKKKRRTFLSDLSKFWQGETTISLPVAAVVLAVLVVGSWQIYTTIFVIKQNSILLLETGIESVRLIEQGVSVL